MANRPPNNLDDTGELSGTQPVNTSRQPSPPGNLPEWGIQPPTSPRDEPAPRKRKPKTDRSRSALYLPAWSVGVMLLLVFGITAAIIMLVYTLGGRVGTGGEPRVLIITAAPTATLETGGEPTSAPTFEEGQVQSFNVPVPTFALEGPTLPPIILSPTPLSITIGATVIVNSDTLRIRPQPSLDNTENFFADEGDRFTVIGGPEQGSGLTWWQVEDQSDPSRTGWAAADYLDVAIQ